VKGTESTEDVTKLVRRIVGDELDV